ncbi:hypothetical protein Mp_1g20960 [Marchantia polymorpha subsp. ruderalis]|uniref:Uncharacterized protein n=2 Tax=Marchantia polymorpha TaxID=3197 RepID=A0AAF6ASH0_MARPO|nr:hypothetical protein MARPO_0001s0431 [Marchantia polymorpha]BBM99390.1 hypothetical protein Mp_1g20960 [Marchantia polymorpha subsp. ruderalis]|eukprot:PTQ50472.1 hypothetical protein MARPO_0001s0431 [Marchantia polymorpha]
MAAGSALALAPGRIAATLQAPVRATVGNLKSARSVHAGGAALQCAPWSVQPRRGARRGAVRASTSGGRELYQPFRPPPTRVEEAPAGAQSVEEMLQVLRDKEGLWYHYASVLPALSRCGFSPSEIDEATGINGHEQNQLVVGSQVRLSLVATGFDKDAIAFFDNGGAEILYELRTLSVQQRRASAEYLMARGMDGKGARDVAKAVKDFERRRNIPGWEQFSSSPGDCLALSLLRQSKEARSANEVEAFIHQALECAESESAKRMLEGVLRSEEHEKVAEKVAKASVTIMRLSSEELPVVLPVCEFSTQAVSDCPSSAAGSSGPFPIHYSSSLWQSFVSVPGWKPIVDAAAPIAIFIKDSKLLPKQVGIKNHNDPILLVVDKGDRIVVASSYFLVDTEGSMTLKAGPEISEGSCTVLGRVLIALRPPLPEDPNEDDTSWE